MKKKIELAHLAANLNAIEQFGSTIASSLSERGFHKPMFEIWVADNGSLTIRLGAHVNNIYSSETMYYFHGRTEKLSDLSKKFHAKVESLVDPDEVERGVIRQKIAKLIDDIRASNVLDLDDIEGIANPLTAMMMKLSENVITHKPDVAAE